LRVTNPTPIDELCDLDIVDRDLWFVPTCYNQISLAGFYLLLHNEKIRDVIDTVGKKGVLLLGRFTEGRLAVLERLRAELRERGYLPIVFNFDKPETKDFTEIKEAGWGTLMTMRMTLPDAPARAAMLATGMKSGMEVSYVRLEGLV
jgi:hypothetical protein